METVLLRLDSHDPDPALLARAAAVLHAGGTVAFPTETVYGLGAHALDADAVQRIFTAKGRPSYNPLIVHVQDAAAARALAATWPQHAQQLADAFWPGPLTMVLPKRTHVPDIVTAGLPSVAVRVPAHPLARALLHAAGLPLAAPSANRFTRVSPTTAQHVMRGLDGRIDMVLDGGATDVGIESTVIDLTGAVPVLLRPGSIGIAQLEAVVGTVHRNTAHDTGETPRPAPGMLDRHYAPDAELFMCDAAAASAVITRAHTAGRTVGMLTHTSAEAGADHTVTLPSDADGYARGLYAALHTLDELECDVVIAVTVPSAAEWDGVRDRLARAARGSARG